MRKVLLVAALSLCRFPASAAPGSSSFNFLKIGVGARQVGMGETGVAVGGDAASAFYNPAGLAGLGLDEASFLHARWLEDSTYQYLAYAHPTPTLGTFAGSLQYVGYGSIPGYDAQGARAGDVSASSLMGGLSWAKGLNDDWTAGATLKEVQQSLAGVRGTAVATDLGVLYQPLTLGPWDGFSAGLAVRNLGTRARFIDQEESLPRSVDAGAAYRAFDGSLVLAVEGHKPSDGDAFANAGGEVWIKDLLALRLGWRSGRDIGNGLTTGFGIKTWLGRTQVQFDYALANFGDFGYTHRLGVSVRFGGLSRRLYQQGLTQMRSGHAPEALLLFDKTLSLEPGYKPALQQIKKLSRELSREGEAPAPANP